MSFVNICVTEAASVTKHNAVNMYGGVKAKLYSFQISALINGSEPSATLSYCIAPWERSLIPIW